ncbi:MAG: CvpA family protein [Hahellaceae bacterium]|nr:CvpA family protein [Hahellaceae bacterium]
MEGFTWADWAIVGVLAVSTLVSLVRGFVREALSLLTWVAAFVVARMFYGNFATLLEGSIETPSLRLLAGFVILFVAALILGSLLSTLLATLVKATGLTGTDRVLGMVFGLFRGVLLVVAMIAVLKLTPLPSDPWWQNSMLIAHFEQIEQWSRTVFGDPLGALFNQS